MNQRQQRVYLFGWCIWWYCYLELTELVQMDEHIIMVKSWKRTDKYPCPKCGKKVGMPDYTCKPCNLVIKPKMQF